MRYPLRVVHYLNQFFAGIGGEEKANMPVQVQEGPQGPGKILQQMLKDQGEVVATIVCGDNYCNEEEEKARTTIEEALQRIRPDVVIAGPAFNAGRYGLACAVVCKAAQKTGIPAVTGMHPENPGVGQARGAGIVVPTGSTAVEMQPALSTMARLAVKLGK
ncbi:MAG: glycine/betaine/sarcosine/D-proline family reductase selenoprotein B, partial [Nitrospinota bacterium]